MLFCMLCGNKNKNKYRTFCSYSCASRYRQNNLTPEKKSELCRRTSETLKRKYASGEIIPPWKGKHIHPNAMLALRRPRSEQHKKSISETLKRKFASGELDYVREKLRDKSLRKPCTPERKEKYSIQSKERWCNIKNDPDKLKIVLSRMSESARTSYKNTELIEIRRKSFNPKINEVLWNRIRSDESYAKQYYESSRGKYTMPNGLEKRFIAFIEKHSLPFKFCGDFSVIIGGKNPDFISTDGSKILIEIYGDYWHGKGLLGHEESEEEQRKINHFSKYGYKTLVIWEKETKQENWEIEVLNKIKYFCQNNLMSSVTEPTCPQPGQSFSL